MTTTLVHDPVVLLGLRAAFALLFVSAARHKLVDRVGFREVLAAYRVVPAAMVGSVAALVPAGELGVALAWLVPGGIGVAVLGTIVLLAIYALAIGVNLWRGRRTIDCGCGLAGTRQAISEWLLARNGVLMLAALATLRPMAARPLVWVDVLTLVGGLAVASSVWMATHGLAVASARVRRVGAGR